MCVQVMIHVTSRGEVACVLHLLQIVVRGEMMVGVGDVLMVTQWFTNADRNVPVAGQAQIIVLRSAEAIIRFAVKNVFMSQVVP